MTFGLSSVFTGKESKHDSTTTSRQGSANIFSMLGKSEIAAEGLTSRDSQLPGRKPFIDLGLGGMPDAAPQRRKLSLLPRPIPMPDEETDETSAASTVESKDGGSVFEVEIEPLGKTEYRVPEAENEEEEVSYLQFESA